MFNRKRFSLAHYGLTICLFTLASANAMALYTTSESAEVIAPGTYAVGVLPELAFGSNAGVNLAGLIDYPVSSETSVRGYLGTGQTAFDAGASFKWIPIPDYGQQPAAGGKIEAETSYNSGVTQNALRFHPLVSKKYETEYGAVIPYGSLPISLISTNNVSTTGIQVVGGAEYHQPDLKRWTFSAELGLNLNNATSYVSGLVSYSFDQPQAESSQPVLHK